MVQQEALIQQLQDQHYVQYMQQCYNQQLLQQQLSQQQQTESTADQQNRSPSNSERQQRTSSPASYGIGSSTTRPETNVIEPQNQKSLPNGLQKSDATDAAMLSDLADDDADPS